MNWVYRFDERALKELKKLGSTAQREIIAYLDDRLAGSADPRRFGKGLKADLAGLWRYRVGDYRILCQIIDRELWSWWLHLAIEKTFTGNLRVCFFLGRIGNRRKGAGRHCPGVPP